MAPPKFSLIRQFPTTNRSRRGNLLLALTCVLLLNSCAWQPPAKSEAVLTPQSGIKSVHVQPTATPQIVDIKNGGFSLAVQHELEVELNDDSIDLSDPSGEFLVSLNGRSYIASGYTLESFLGKYLDELVSRGGTLHASEPYAIVVDGKDGVAVNVLGSFLGTPIAGKAVAISPGKDFIVFGLGMSLLSVHQNHWNESGSVIFEDLLESIDFKNEVSH
jgi:hypothetical protein